MITEIWQRISDEKAHEIIRVVNETNKKLYRKTLDLLSPHMGVRAAIVLEMPKRERHGVWIGFFREPQYAAFAFNFLSWWLMNQHQAMLAMWLDALKIKHVRGVAEAFPEVEPSAGQLRHALDLLMEVFNPEDVKIYLRAFYEIDEVQWPALKLLIETDPRLLWG
jgi:hypothetical protein